MQLHSTAVRSRSKGCAAHPTALRPRVRGMHGLPFARAIEEFCSPYKKMAAFTGHCSLLFYPRCIIDIPAINDYASHRLRQQSGAGAGLCGQFHQKGAGHSASHSLYLAFAPRRPTTAPKPILAISSRLSMSRWSPAGGLPPVAKWQPIQISVKNIVPPKAATKTSLKFSWSGGCGFASRAPLSPVERTPESGHT